MICALLGEIHQFGILSLFLLCVFVMCLFLVWRPSWSEYLKINHMTMSLLYRYLCVIVLERRPSWSEHLNIIFIILCLLYLYLDRFYIILCLLYLYPYLDRLRTASILIWTSTHLLQCRLSPWSQSERFKSDLYLQFLSFNESLLDQLDDACVIFVDGSKNLNLKTKI